jgi:hypothetical protein
MLNRARTTGLALLAVGALVVAGCGDSKEDEAREQASSVISQANEAQSDALSQAQEAQSQVQEQAQSALDGITQGLDDLTAPDTAASEPVATESADTGAAPDVSVPEISIPDVSIPDISIPDVSIPDVSIPEVPSGETVPAATDTVAAADLIAPDELKAVLEEATGVTLGDLAGAAGPGGAGFSNQATMIQDGQAVFAYVLTDPQAAELFASAVPQIPGVAGSANVTHKNVIVVYASFGQTDRSKEVEAAVKAL